MIVKAALLLFRGPSDEKELLFAKARGKPYLIFPGGKQEPGETVDQALIRELQEELQVGASHIRQLGVVEGATPDGRPLKMHLYTAELIGEAKPSAEIESIRWMNKVTALQNTDLMTPMTLKHVFPFLSQNHYW